MEAAVEGVFGLEEEGVLRGVGIGGRSWEEERRCVCEGIWRLLKDVRYTLPSDGSVDEA